MAEENKEESTAPTGNVGKGITIIAVIIVTGILLFLLISAINNNSNNKATLADIDGDWNQTTTTQSYVFIPKSNIDGLEFTFTLKDKNNRTVDTITKTVGNVKKGQQYTVTINLLEVDDLSSFLSISTTSISVSKGTKKLF